MEILSRRELISVALTIVCIIAAGFPAAAQDVVRVETELVNLPVVVRDREGRRVSGLLKEDFEVFEDGSRQEITHFSIDERPLRLVLVFDVSLSMDAVLPTVKQGALTLLGSLRPDDEVSIVSFASDVRPLSGWLKAEQAKDIVNNLQPEPHPLPQSAITGRPGGYRVGDVNTYLYEAFQHLFTQVKNPDDRIAFIMFSDGVDTAAGRAIPNIQRRIDELAKEVLRLAQESWGLVYPIRYKTEQIIGDQPAAAPRSFPNIIRIGSAPSDPGRGLFAKITAASGGEIFDWTTRADLLVAVGNLLADLRSQYGVGYRPALKTEAGFRRLKVRVKRPNLVVRTREGYIYRQPVRPRRATSP